MSAGAAATGPTGAMMPTRATEATSRAAEASVRGRRHHRAKVAPPSGAEQVAQQRATGGGRNHGRSGGGATGDAALRALRMHGCAAVGAEIHVVYGGAAIAAKCQSCIPSSLFWVYFIRKGKKVQAFGKNVYTFFAIGLANSFCIRRMVC